MTLPALSQLSHTSPPRVEPTSSRMSANKSQQIPLSSAVRQRHRLGVGFHGTDAMCVIEQLWPGVNVELASAHADRIASAASSRAGDGRIRVLGATLIPDDETLFIWCAAPSGKVVRELLTASGIPFDRVLDVLDASL
jgi:hypothetical protein